jgi:hypothetical protein
MIWYLFSDMGCIKSNGPNFEESRLLLRYCWECKIALGNKISGKMFVATNTSVQRGAASLLSSAARYGTYLLYLLYLPYLPYLPVPTVPTCTHCSGTYCTFLYLLYLPVPTVPTIRYLLCRPVPAVPTGPTTCTYCTYHLSEPSVFHF